MYEYQGDGGTTAETDAVYNPTIVSTAGRDSEAGVFNYTTMSAAVTYTH